MQNINHDSETPAHNQQVFTACAFIHAEIDGERKIFLPKRADSKKFLPGMFELPGGHVDFGEEMKAGLIREIKEELEMDVKVGDPFFVFTYTNPIKGSHSIEVIYFAQFTSDIKDIKLNPEDHSEYLWLSEQEIEEVYVDNNGQADIELEVIMKGFGILNGHPVNT